MPLTDRNPLLRPLHLLGPHLQHPHHTRLLLPLRHNHNHIPLVHLLISLLPTRQSPPFTRHPRRHQRRPTEHKPDRTAVNSQTPKALWVHVHDLQVRYQRVVHVLPEQGHGLVVRARIAEDVERDSIGELDGIELGLLGDEGVDVWCEEGVCFEDFAADCACYGRFDFGLGRGGEPARGREMCQYMLV